MIYHDFSNIGESLLEAGIFNIVDNPYLYYDEGSHQFSFMGNYVEKTRSLLGIEKYPFADF